MPKYLLEVVENNGYLIEVEAASEEEAERMYTDGKVDSTFGEHTSGENYVERVSEVSSEVS